MIYGVVHHLLESTVFALLVGLLTLCWQRRGAGVRHVLWCIAAAKFALPLTILVVWGASLRQLLPSAHWEIFAPVNMPSLMQLQLSQPAVVTPAHSWITISALLIWLAGFAAMLTAWLPKLFEQGDSSELGSETEQELFNELVKRVGLRSSVQLRISNSRREPALCGFWKPNVTLPSDISRQLSPVELEAILLHELAHEKRKDNWTGAFVHALACIFWFYPLLLWIERRLHRERELACDEMVVRWGSAPDDYIAGILKVCRFHLGEGVAGVSGVSRSNLKRRMEEIMSFSSWMPVVRVPKILLGALMAMVLLVPMAIGLTVGAAVHGQNSEGTKEKPASANSAATPTCAFDSVEYPEGTVIQVKGGPEQMCASVQKPAKANDTGAPQYAPQWIHTNKEIRNRAQNIVQLEPQPVIVCTPIPASRAKVCSCEGSGDFSYGANVDSPKGKLRCDKGKWVQLATTQIEKK